MSEFESVERQIQPIVTLAQGADNNASNSGTFILGSPTSTASTANQMALKKTKYSKLYKLHKDLLEKKQKTITEKTTQLQSLKQLLRKQKPEIAEQNKILEKNLEQLRRENLLNQHQGQEKSKILLKTIYDLDFQIAKQTENNIKLKQQVNGADKLLSDHKNSLAQLESSLKSKQNELANLAGRFNDIITKNKNSQIKSQIILNLEAEKTKLSNEINEKKAQCANIEGALKKKRQQNVANASAGAQLAKKAEEAKKQLADLIKSNQEAQKTRSELEAKIKKQKQSEQKVGKNLQALEKNLKDEQDSLNKLKKQQEDKKQKLKKVQDQNSQKQSSKQIQQLRGDIAKLKSKLDHHIKLYRQQQDKSEGLVPFAVVQRLKKQILTLQEYKKQNGDVSTRIHRAQQQIEENLKKKESLEWDDNPILKDLDKAKGVQQENQSKIQSELKALNKQLQKTTKILDQYKAQYPEYEINKEKKRAAQAAAAAAAAAALAAAKKEEAKKAEGNKKGKKNKNDQKSPQSQVIHQKSEKKAKVEVEQQIPAKKEGDDTKKKEGKKKKK